jgi:hypothetical protein
MPEDILMSTIRRWIGLVLLVVSFGMMGFAICMTFTMDGGFNFGAVFLFMLGVLLGMPGAILFRGLKVDPFRDADIFR